MTDADCLAPPAAIACSTDSFIRLPASATTMPNEEGKIFAPSREETCRFDPTSIGLPAGWSLTDWSTLKG